MAGGFMDWADIIAFIRAAGAAEVANLGVLLVALGGILFTRRQLVLLRRQLQLDALIKITDSNRELLILGFEHPNLVPLLNPEGSVVLHRYLQLWTNHLYLMWGANRLDMIREGDWQAYRLDMAELLRLPAFQEHWSQVERFYPRRFRQLIAELRQPSAD